MREGQISDALISGNHETTEWIVTFADLMTLLLVFFVLLYTLSSFKTHKYEAAVEKIKTNIENDADLTGLMELMEIPETADTQITIEDITGLRSRKDLLLKEVNRFAARGEQGNQITARIVDGKVTVRIRGELLFPSGSAELNQSARPLIEELVRVFFDYPDYNINIRGHTDDIPIATETYASNWELSAIRATTVLKHLVGAGINPERLTATGYGKIMPLVPNNSAKNRAINRRVEFVLEKKETIY